MANRVSDFGRSCPGIESRISHYIPGGAAGSLLYTVTSQIRGGDLNLWQKHTHQTQSRASEASFVSMSRTASVLQREIKLHETQVENLKRTRCRVTHQKGVGNSQHLIGGGGLIVPAPSPHTPNPVSSLPNSPSHLPSPVSCLSSTVVSHETRQVTQ